MLAAVLALGAPFVGAPASAAGREIVVEDNVFTPRRIKVSVGALVTWRGDGGSAGHNVRQDRKIFYSGEPHNESFAYERRFSSGSFHYYCEIHGFPSGGMDGVVKVPVRVVKTSATTLKVAWATSSTNTGSRFDVDYRIGSGKWKSWKRGVSKLAASFGVTARPVAVRPGVRYSFRARSLRAGRSSGWSPVRSITP